MSAKREGMPRAQPKEAITQESAPHEVTVFPAGDALLDRYKEGYKADEASIETMREILYTAIDEGLDNSTLFKSEGTGAEFPYTSLNVRSLAQKVFKSNGGVPTPTESAEIPNESIKREFITTAFPVGVDWGGQFEWIELGLHELMRALPEALEDLKAGRELEGTPNLRHFF
jgi:hypothetical protein